MPLHRDIHWIGRQWAVTGHGMQLIDQKLQGFFDIEVGRLWDDALVESVHAKEWLNTADFDKGLALARARYPQPSGAVLPPRQVAPAQPAALPPVVKSIEPKPEPARLETPRLETLKPIAPALATRAAVEPPIAVTPVVTREPPKPAPALEKPVAVEPPRAQSLFQMRYECHAQFVRPWRVVTKRPT